MYSEVRVGGPLSEENGRIRLTWGQIVWAVGVIVAVLGSWADNRVWQAKMDGRMDAIVGRVVALENRNTLTGFTQRDAEQMRAEIMREVSQQRRRR